jgi:hypothetical protein
MITSELLASFFHMVLMYLGNIGILPQSHNIYLGRRCE